MAVLDLSLSSDAKNAGLNELFEGNSSIGSAKEIKVQLFNGSTSVSSVETIKFKKATVVSGTQNAKVESHAGVMFSVDNGKTVNKIIFSKTVGASTNTMLYLTLTGGDVEEFTSNGTFTINSVAFTLREAS